MDASLSPSPSPTTAMRIARLEDQVAALAALIAQPEPPPEDAPRRRAPRTATIIAACARIWDVPVETIHSVRRDRRYAWPRQVAMFLSRELGHHSLIALGRAFGRDHSTVLYAVRVVRARCHADPDFAALVDSAAALSHTLTQEAPRP